MSTKSSNDTQRKINVMQAYNEGYDIEVRELTTTEWHLSQTPSWDWGRYTYRVVRIPRRFFLRARSVFSTKEGAENYGGQEEIIEVEEVMR